MIQSSSDLAHELAHLIGKDDAVRVSDPQRLASTFPETAIFKVETVERRRYVVRIHEDLDS